MKDSRRTHALLMVFAVSLGGVSLAASAQTYTYDSVGLLTKVEFSNGARMEFTYDRAGNRVTETYGAAVVQMDKAIDSPEFIGPTWPTPKLPGEGEEPENGVAKFAENTGKFVTVVATFFWAAFSAPFQGAPAGQ